MANLLVCEKIVEYCPEPAANTSGVVFSTTLGLRLNSVLSHACSYGWEHDVPMEREALLTCRPGPLGGGQWVTVDTTAIADFPLFFRRPK